MPLIEPQPTQMPPSDTAVEMTRQLNDAYNLKNRIIDDKATELDLAQWQKLTEAQGMSLSPDEQSKLTLNKIKHMANLSNIDMTKMLASLPDLPDIPDLTGQGDEPTNATAVKSMFVPPLKQAVMGAANSMIPMVGAPLDVLGVEAKRLKLMDDASLLPTDAALAGLRKSLDVSPPATPTERIADFAGGLAGGALPFNLAFNAIGGGLNAVKAAQALTTVSEGVAQSANANKALSFSRGLGSVSAAVLPQWLQTVLMEFNKDPQLLTSFMQNLSIGAGAKLSGEIVSGGNEGGSNEVGTGLFLFYQMLRGLTVKELQKGTSQLSMQDKLGQWFNETNPGKAYQGLRNPEPTAEKYAMQAMQPTGKTPEEAVGIYTRGIETQKTVQNLHPDIKLNVPQLVGGETTAPLTVQNLIRQSNETYNKEIQTSIIANEKAIAEKLRSSGINPDITPTPTGKTAFGLFRAQQERNQEKIQSANEGLSAALARIRSALEQETGEPLVTQRLMVDDLRGSKQQFDNLLAAAYDKVNTTKLVGLKGDSIPVEMVFDGSGLKTALRKLIPIRHEIKVSKKDEIHKFGGDIAETASSLRTKAAVLGSLKKLVDRPGDYVLLKELLDLQKELNFVVVGQSPISVFGGSKQNANQALKAVNATIDDLIAGKQAMNIPDPLDITKQRIKISKITKLPEGADALGNLRAADKFFKENTDIFNGKFREIMETNFSGEINALALDETGKAMLEQIPTLAAYVSKLKNKGDVFYNPTAVENIKNVVRLKFNAAVTDTDMTTNATAVAQWNAKNQSLLAIFPELKREFASIGKNAGKLTLVTEQIKDANILLNRQLLGRAANLPNGESVIPMIAKLNDPKAAIVEMQTRIRRSADFNETEKIRALEGLKREFMEHAVLGKSQGKLMDSAGVQAFYTDASKLDNILKTHGDTIKQLFGAEHVKNLKDIRDIAAMNQQIPFDSASKALNLIEDPKRAISATIAMVINPTRGRSGFPQEIALAGGKGLANMLAKEAQVHYEKLMLDALANPAAARALFDISSAKTGVQIQKARIKLQAYAIWSGADAGADFGNWLDATGKNNAGNKQTIAELKQEINALNGRKKGLLK